MSEALDTLFKNGTEKMEKAVNQLHREFSTVRTGRANPAMLDKVMVEYYGAPTPLKQMAQVTVSEGTSLVIAPFDKSILKEVEKAIIKAELGVAPNNDGVSVRLNFPPLTEEKRKEIYFWNNRRFYTRFSIFYINDSSIYLYRFYWNTWCNIVYWNF